MTRQQKVRGRPANRGQRITRIPQLSKFARSLLREWRKLKLPQVKATAVVAVSGGADSTALLLVLDELAKSKKLKIKLVVAHLNHKLRGKASDADARWVREITKKLGHQIVTARVDVKRRAAQTGDNLEQAARRARYEFLEKIAKARKAGVVMTAHTMDDQAETVLMNLLRGSGTYGLSGIEPVRSIGKGSGILLARPLMSWASRSETESYCRERSIDYRVDEMNADETLTRVRVRRQLLPLMKTFNPKLVETLTRTTEILREDCQALDRAAARLLELSLDSQATNRSKEKGERLRIDLLRLAEPALRRRALRLWIGGLRGDLRRLEHVHVVAIENLLFSTKSGRAIELPGGAGIRRKESLLHYVRSQSKRMG